MPQPKLDLNYGQFTLTDQELLRMSIDDLKSTLIQNGDQTVSLKHYVDYRLEPIIKMIAVVMQCLRFKGTSVKVQQINSNDDSKLFQLEFSKWFKPQFNSCISVLEAYISEEVEVGIECLAFDDARKQLTVEEINFLKLEGKFHLSDKEGITRYAALLNHFIDLIRAYMHRPEVKRKIRDRNSNCHKMKLKCVLLVQALIAKYAKILVVRIDFSLKRELKTLLKHHVNIKKIHSKNDLAYFKRCITKLLVNQRHNPVMKNIKGYILRYEYTVQAGFHVHAYFFFDGNKHREDITLAEAIVELWTKATGSQGSTYICNKKKEDYKALAIGMIHHSDTQKLGYLFKTFDYICKTDQLFMYSNMVGARSFQLSHPPIPKAKSGRPRMPALSKSHP